MSRRPGRPPLAALTWLGAGWLAAAWLGAAVGCAGIRRSDLPPEPLAVLARSGEDGKKRAEILHPSRELQVERAMRSASGVLDANSALDHLTGETPDRKLRETLGRVTLIDPRSGDAEELDVAGAGARPVEWSPDHRVLLYMQPVRGRAQIFAYDRETREVRPVRSGPHRYPFASVAHEGRIAYSEVTGSGSQMSSRIFVTETGGRMARPVSPGPSDFDPAWSPTGDFVIFGRLLPGQVYTLARVDPDSGDPPHLIARGRDAVFTPDGKWVVFSSHMSRGWRLRRMRPDGSAKQWIGGGSVEGFDELHPAVSPDGRYVAYVSVEVGRERLRIRRIDGTGDRPLYDHGDAGNPVW